MSEAWGTVKVGKDEDGYIDVAFENSQLYCRYGTVPIWDDEHNRNLMETFIVDFTDKASGGQNMVWNGESYIGRIDAAAWREYLTHAEVIRDDDERKTVRMEWSVMMGPAAIQEVSIFKDSRYLQIDFIGWFVNIVDIASPGGTNQGQYEIYGADQWKRDYVLYEKTYYNGTTHDCGCDVPMEEPGPLVYNGCFIMGVYHPENGHGFGRVLPASDISIIKRLHNRGFELFPQFGLSHTPFSSYLYAVTGGAEEIITVGKTLADRLNS